MSQLRLDVDRLSGDGKVSDAQVEAGADLNRGLRESVQRLISNSPAVLTGRDLLNADWVDTPIGAMLAVADQDALHILEFCDRPALATELTRVQKATQSSISFGRTPLIDQIEAELRVYFSGDLRYFLTPLVLHGSAFTRRVWDALVAIPFGTTRSYGQLASGIDQPTAVRAVARANGANQISIVIPCHRVIGWDGSLTGYGGGLWRKRWLLDHERRFANATPTVSRPSPT